MKYTDLKPLGSAGCYDICSERFCNCFKVSDENNFVCSKYGELKKHPDKDQPWRHNQCGADA